MIRLLVPLAAFVCLAPSFGSFDSDKGERQTDSPSLRVGGNLAEAISPASPRATIHGGGDVAGFTPPPAPLAPPVDQHDHVQFGEMREGGDTSPSGLEINCDLPAALRMQNVGGRDGAGLCVFTSIMHASRYQNEKRLWNFQKDMTKELGGGYPDKVDTMIAKYGPGTKYVQHEGGDVDFLYQAIKTGRMVSVTYDGRDPRYGRQRIAHMVNLVHLDPPEKSPRYAGILDNNFTKEVLWMTVDEFKSRWLGNHGGWAVVLLAPRPPLAPRN